MSEDTGDEADDRPSKGARKREAQALQDLGEELIRLPDAIFTRLELPDGLKDAILEARRLTSHGALFRQRQYIGKLMRKIDAQPIREEIERHRVEQQSGGARFHRIEAWRDRLIREGVTSIPALRADAPGIDAGEVAKLLAAVERANGDQVRRTAARALFRYLDRNWGQS